ncbi:unnamed protein product [Ectocarpus sp. 4 AP-2014]
MRWATLGALLLCKASAFHLPGVVRVGPSRRANSVLERREARHAAGRVLACTAKDEGDKGVADEDDPLDLNLYDFSEAEITDAELDKMLQAVEHGISRHKSKALDSKAGQRGEVDEAKMIMLLRQKMGKEDFYAVFDPRNPRIGDV